MSGAFQTAVFETPLATVAAIWRQGLLLQILLESSGRATLERQLAATCPGLQAPPPAIAAGFAAALDAYLERRLDFSLPLEGLHLGRLPPFHRDVLLALKSVPLGRVVSYSGLASLSGRPGAARAVGSAMANNPFPLLFPCHRVAQASRGLGGFGPGQDMKRALLRHEGVVPDADGLIPQAFFL